jgi:hypothetical protein
MICDQFAPRRAILQGLFENHAEFSNNPWQVAKYVTGARLGTAKPA